MHSIPGGIKTALSLVLILAWRTGQLYAMHAYARVCVFMAIIPQLYILSD